MTEKVSGIYKIVNRINGKYYVGSSLNTYVRWTNGHRRHLRRNNHENKHLQSAWNKYGEDNFNFSVVEVVASPTADKLLGVEQVYLNIAKTETDKCYNKNFVASGGYIYPKPPMSGRKHTLESKLKNSASNKIAQNGLNNAHADHTIRKFYNTKTGEVFEGTRYEFCVKYPKCKNNLTWLISGNGRVKSVHGWVLDPNSQHGQCKAETHVWTDHKIYTLENTNTNQIFVGKRFEFMRTFGFRLKPALFKGSRNIDHGWVIRSF